MLLSFAYYIIPVPSGADSTTAFGNLFLGLGCSAPAVHWLSRPLRRTRTLGCPAPALAYPPWLPPSCLSGCPPRVGLGSYAAYPLLFPARAGRWSAVTGVLSLPSPWRDGSCSPPLPWGTPPVPWFPWSGWARRWGGRGLPDSWGTTPSSRGISICPTVGVVRRHHVVDVQGRGLRYKCRCRTRTTACLPPSLSGQFRRKRGSSFGGRGLHDELSVSLCSRRSV